MSSSVTQLCSRGDNFPCWCHCWFPARCLWNSAFSCPRRRRVCKLNSSSAGPLVSWPRNHELVHAWQLFKLILRVNFYSAVDTVSVLPLLCLYIFFICGCCLVFLPNVLQVCSFVCLFVLSKIKQQKLAREIDRRLCIVFIQSFVKVHHASSITLFYPPLPPPPSQPNRTKQ